MSLEADKSRKTGPAPSGAALRQKVLPEAQRLALAWTHSARFLTTASQLNQLPVHEMPEIAFVGRSNAGKSTAINTLAQQKRLAFASRTPGRTQHINLFEVGPKDRANALLADLPGYGYAAVERSAKLRWQEVMARYLEVRRSLSGVVLMVDSRLGLTDLDQQLISFTAPRVRTGEVKLLVLLTKCDKLNRSERQKILNATQEELGDLVTEAADVNVALFSALSKEGLGDVAELLLSWVTAAPEVPDMPDPADLPPPEGQEGAPRVTRSGQDEPAD